MVGGFLWVLRLLPEVRGDTPASSTTKTGRHDIAEILLKVALNKQLVNIITCGCESSAPFLWLISVLLT
jgi:hypothetical protein